MAVRSNDSNNGYLALSTRDAAERVRWSIDTAARALTELIAKGFIECCSRGHFNCTSLHASDYRLPLYSCDRTNSFRSPPLSRHWHEPHQQPIDLVRPSIDLA